MAYTIVPTITTGDIATAAWGNTYIKNNFAAGVPDIFTADGEVAIGTAANTAESVAILDSSNRLKHEYGGLEFDASGVTTGDTVVGQSSGVIGLETAMSQVEAEDGTDTQVRGITAQRISQAITAQASRDQSSQAALEAETDEATAAPPDRIKYSPGVAKFWVKFLNTTIDGISYNVDSITDDDVGKWTVNIGTDFSNTDEVVQVTALIGSDAEHNGVVRNITTGTVQVMNFVAGTLTDPLRMLVSAHGDQA